MHITYSDIIFKNLILIFQVSTVMNFIVILVSNCKAAKPSLCSTLKWTLAAVQMIKGDLPHFIWRTSIIRDIKNSLSD